MPVPTDGGHTSAAEWRSPRVTGMLLTLPSGNKARVKRTLSMLAAIENNTLPNTLAAHVAKQLRDRGIDKELQEAIKDESAGQIEMGLEDMDEETNAAMVRVINQEVPNIFLMPRVYMLPDDFPEDGDPSTWQPDDPDGISILDVSFEDRVFAYSFAQGGPATLAPFPHNTEDVGDPSPGDEVQLPPLGDAGD